jgi:hypothetical protein
MAKRCFPCRIGQTFRKLETAELVNVNTNGADIAAFDRIATSFLCYCGFTSFPRRSCNLSALTSL